MKSGKKPLFRRRKSWAFPVSIIPDGQKVGPQDVSDSEIIFGMVPRGVLKDAGALRWMQCSFAGVDAYCDRSLYTHPITLTNASGAYGITISEHMVVTLLMLMRRMPEYHEMQKRREWYCVGEVKSVMNSVITVVGIGDIGSNFAKRVRAMGATVRGVRRSQGPKPDFVDEVYTVDRLDEAIAGADVVALCLPGTRETQKIFDRERLLKMKEGAILLNVGRGSASILWRWMSCCAAADWRRGGGRHRSRAPAGRPPAVGGAARPHHPAHIGQYLPAADMRHHCRHLPRQPGALRGGTAPCPCGRHRAGILSGKQQNGVKASRDNPGRFCRYRISIYPACFGRLDRAGRVWITMPMMTKTSPMQTRTLGYS